MTGQADRTLRLLQRLAKGMKGQEQLEALVAPGRVAVRLGADVAIKPQAQLIFSFAVNLLARLHPVIQNLRIILPADVPLRVHVPRWGAGTIDAHLRQFLHGLNPPLRWEVNGGGSDPADCTLLVGGDSVLAKGPIFVGSEGWLAGVSPLSPVCVGDLTNPVGAYAAACLGVGEIWKRLLEPHSHLFPAVPIVPSREPLNLSTFTYRSCSAASNPGLHQCLDLHRLTVVGLGAGGGALAFTLASLSDLRGTLNLIDPDEITDSNLNRAVPADWEDAVRQRPKASVTADLFRRFPALQVRVFPTPYREALASLSAEDYRYVAALVHSREARRGIQCETPMVLWDAGATETGEFFLWRLVLGTTQCMYCKHPLRGQDPEQEKALQLAALLGLGATTWLRKLRENERFAPEEIAAITAHLAGKGVSFDIPVPGQRFDDWQAGQCGRLSLPEADEEIPIPFAPVMAGVLLAGEIIKEHCFPEGALDSYYWNTLVGRFMSRNQPHRRLPVAGCDFCKDEEYLRQYERRWGMKPGARPRWRLLGGSQGL